MKFIAFIAAVCLLASCTKENLHDVPIVDQSEPVSCDFGIGNFNLQKREPVQDELLGKGKPPRFNWSNVYPNSPVNPSVLLLDFDGHTVSNTAWNVTGDLVCAPANMTTEAQSQVFERIVNDYSPFNVVITTDEGIFNNTPSNKRMRVIFTESWEWFGQAGGAAFLNTFGYAVETPCFVFTSLLNYNPKAIAEAGAHELGHTLGLSHQSSYSGTTLLNAYNYGTGSGETAWAPIMGCAYYRNLSTWHNGATSNGPSATQDELAIINAKLGALPDDYSGTTTGAQSLVSSKNGMIHHSGDTDMFFLDLSGTTTITATPISVGAGNNGANLDLVLKVYDDRGALLSTVNDPSVLHASATLPSGEYFVVVSVEGNSNVGSYGMVGKYLIDRQ